MNSLSYYAQVIVRNELWVSNNRFNGLFKINLETNKVVFIGRFAQYRAEDEELHMFAKRYKDKIYFFPKRGRGIDIYNMRTGDFTYIECKKSNSDGYVTAIDAFCSDEDTILIVPCYSGTPLQVFSISKEAIIESISLEVANSYVKNEADAMILYACKIQDEILYPIHGTNKVGSYNFKEKKEKIYILEELKEILGDIVFDGSDLWINADRCIYQWNPFKDKLKLIDDCSSEADGWIEQFVIFDQRVICIPRWLNNITIINRQNLKQKKIHIDKSALYENTDMTWRDVRESLVWRDNLMISPVKYKEAIFINLNTFKVICEQYKFSKIISIKGDFFIREKLKEDLQSYFAIIDEDKKAYTKADDGYIGNDILKKIVSAIG